MLGLFKGKNKGKNLQVLQVLLDLEKLLYRLLLELKYSLLQMHSLNSVNNLINLE